MELVKNVPPPYIVINREKKRQQIAFRRIMHGETKRHEIIQHIGCDLFTLRSYISSFMTEGITWNNYGSDWVIDHIVPMRLFDIFSDADLKLVWNYRNLMPLMKRDNLHKEGDLRLSLILLAGRDDGSEVIAALKKRASSEIHTMDKYIAVGRVSKHKRA